MRRSNIPRFVLVVVVAGLATAPGGCATSRRASFVVEMNGRHLGFETFRDGKIPRGDEVSHFDFQRIRVEGDEPIEVNGMSIMAKGDDITIAGHRLSLHPGADILIRKNGEIEVRLSAKLPVDGKESLLEDS